MEAVKNLNHKKGGNCFLPSHFHFSRRFMLPRMLFPQPLLSWANSPPPNSIYLANSYHFPPWFQAFTEPEKLVTPLHTHQIRGYLVHCQVTCFEALLLFHQVSSKMGKGYDAALHTQYPASNGTNQIVNNGGLSRPGFSCYPRELFPCRDCQGTSSQAMADSFEETAMEKTLSELAPHGACPKTRTHFPKKEHYKWAIPGRKGVQRLTLHWQFH